MKLFYVSKKDEAIAQSVLRHLYAAKDTLKQVNKVLARFRRKKVILPKLIERMVHEEVLLRLVRAFELGFSTVSDNDRMTIKNVSTAYSRVKNLIEVFEEHSSEELTQLTLDDVTTKRLQQAIQQIRVVLPEIHSLITTATNPPTKIFDHSRKRLFG